MILKCKPSYNFQSIEYEYEIDLETGEGFKDCMDLYSTIIDALKKVAPEQPINKTAKKEKPFIPATDGQINYLLSLGVSKEEAEKMDKNEAWKKIKEMTK